MIFTPFIKLLGYFIGLIASLLPAGSVGTIGWVSSVALIWGYVLAYKWLLPVDTLVTVLKFVLAFEFLMTSFYGINWLLRKIPWMGIK